MGLAANSAKHVLAELKSMHAQSVNFKNNGFGQSQPLLLSELHGCQLSVEQVCSPEFSGVRARQIEQQPAAALQDAVSSHGHAARSSTADVAAPSSCASSMLRVNAELERLENLNRTGNQAAQICINNLVKNSDDLEAATPKAKPRGSASFFRFMAEVRRGTPKLKGETPQQHADRSRAIAKDSWKASQFDKSSMLLASCLRV